MIWSAKEPPVEIPDISLVQCLTDKFQKWGSRMAMVDEVTGKEFKYSELKEAIDRVAGSLYHVAGVRKGDVVCACLPNGLEYALLLLSAPAIGAVVTGCNPAYTPDEICYQVQDCGAKVFFTYRENTKVNSEVLRVNPNIKFLFLGLNESGEADPHNAIYFDNLLRDGPRAPTIRINPKEDVCLLPYSSGTTGIPKGVMLTHSNLVSAIAIYTERKQVQVFRNGLDTTVQVFPLFHLGGMFILYTALGQGVTVILLPKFEPVTFFSTIGKYKCPIVAVPPPVLVLMAKSPIMDNFDISCLKRILTGAAPSSSEIHKEVQERFPYIKEIRQIYGMTENSATCTIQRPGEFKYGAVGTVLPNTQYKIVDTETGEELPAGKHGEICSRGPSTMKGYHNDPEKTAVTIKNGWLYTGDIGYFDEEGHLYISDRLKDLIKVKGFQVAPAELEALLLTHPAVADSAVIGLPDLYSGELPRAYITLRSGHKVTEDEIKNFVKGKVVSYKQLNGGVEFIAEIPKSQSGKILRRELRMKLKEALKSKI